MSQNSSGTAGKIVDIRPATGKLGILLPGMGAVATTFIAGVEAMRRGISKPVGSLTQKGTIRLGKRTEHASPLISEFVPLAKLEDIVFGGWDLFPDDAYQAAAKAGVLSKEHLDQLKDFLSTVKPMTSVFDQTYVKKLTATHAKKGKSKKRPGRPGDRRHQELQEEQRLRAPGHGVVRLDRGLPQPQRGPRHAGVLREGAGGERSGDRPLADLRLRGPEERRPLQPTVPRT